MTKAAPLTPGMRLRSQVCETQVIVIRSGVAGIGLRCGGEPMIPLDETPADGLVLDPSLSGGSPLGRRFTSESDDVLELLVTRAGRGRLCDGSTPLVEREARQLPASD